MSIDQNKIEEAIHAYMPLYSDTEIRNIIESLKNFLNEYSLFLTNTYSDENFVFLMLYSVLEMEC